MNERDQARGLTARIGRFARVRYTAPMINLILLSLSLANPKPALTAQFRPCVWPNVCKAEAPAPVIAQFTSCVWPNRCGKKISL